MTNLQDLASNGLNSNAQSWLDAKLREDVCDKHFRPLF